uniref:dolichyl-phosphate-mannose--protein mannosyltransferase n=1 Tax=Cynoglossus semilaevis TaxID=244447 RepID=A0A3P8UUS5_CYNSE
MFAELLCGAVALVLYVNTLGADFCYDDSRAIKTNQDLLPETPWTNIFYDDFWGTLLTHSGSHKSFRPLCTLSFRLNYAVGGLEPLGYHLVNAAFHGAVTVLFTSLARLLLGGGLWSLLAGLLFASHPIHTEAVAGVVGRADEGAALFFLLSLLSYIHHCRLRGRVGGGGWSLLAGRLCASHPIHTEAVAGVVGRADEGAALFFLLSLLSYIHHCRLRGHTGSWRVTAWFICSLGCAACSMLWKELGVTVLAVSALYDICVFHRLKLQQVIELLYKRKNFQLLLNVFLLAAWGVVLLACRFYWMGNKPPNFSNSDNPAADSSSLLTRTLTFFYLPVINYWLLLCPDMLSFDWSMDALPLIRSISDRRNISTVVFYLGLLTLAWFGLWTRHTAKGKETNGKVHHHTNGKNGNSNGHVYQYSNHEHFNNSHCGVESVSAQNGTRKHFESRTPLPTTENVVVFSLGLLSIPFLPATNLFFYVGFVIAERVLYIPSMGFCLLVAVGMRSLYVRLRHRPLRTTLVYCCTVLVLLFSVKTVLRNRDWQNEEMLYKSGIYVNPAKAWGNLGNVLKSQGKMEEAEKAYRNALYYRSNMADMLYNLGLLLQESNKFAEALHYYKLAIGSRPTLASAYLNTGIILMNQGRSDEAKRTFLTCADIPDENLKDPHAHKSSVTSCLYNMGKMLHEQGHQEEALSVFKEAIQKMPRQFAPQSLYNMMGEAYIRLNKLTEAEHWYRESLRAKPDHIPAHLTYGKLLAMTGQKTEAEKYFLKAIQLDPTKGNCYMHYGQFLLEESRLQEAAEMAEKAARLDGGEFDVVFSAAHMLRKQS